MDNMPDRFNLARIKEYIEKAASEQQVGVVGVGLDFIASCAESENEKSAKKRDARIFYLFCNKVYHDSNIKGEGNMPHSDATKFFKRVISRVRSYELQYPENTLLGNFIRYMDRRNLGYSGLGTELLEVDFKYLEFMAKTNCSKSALVRKGAGILLEHFSGR